MENTTNEGQTQVYADGGINPQAGVQTDAPFLNQPRQQLLDIMVKCQMEIKVIKLIIVLQ
jgi:hypothetical protein